MAAIKFERIFQLVQTLARGLVTAVDDPPIGVQKRCWPKVAVAVPPIAGAGGGAGGAHHAFIEPVQFLAVFDGLAPFLFGALRFRLKPWHD